MTQYKSLKLHVELNVEVYTENLVKHTKNLTMGATINQHKPCELNMEVDVYAPSRGPNMSCQGYKGMTGVVTKFDAQQR